MYDTAVDSSPAACTHVTHGNCSSLHYKVERSQSIVLLRPLSEDTKWRAHDICCVHSGMLML